MATRVKKILVPTDFSECSMAATDEALSLARTFQAQIILLHVMESPVYGLDFSLTHPGVLPGIRHKVLEMVQQLVDRMKEAGIEAEGHFATGVPFVEIIKAAQKHEADLIVMGTHGRTGLAHLFLGSVAEKVVRKSKVPVLTVRSS